MILRFGVANFRSLRDFQEFSLVATVLTDSGGALFEEPQLGHQVLPSAAIYGANASGKSNFIAAIRFLCTLVEQSYQAGKPGSPIPVVPFRLDTESRDKPTQFDIDFVHNGTRFNFSCSVTSERVVMERLVSYPQRRRQTWYSREGSTFTFGKALRGENRSVEAVCRENSLFISAAVASSHEQLADVSRFFTDSLVFPDSSPNVMDSTYGRYWRESPLKRRLVGLLRAADVGIGDFDIEAPQATDEDRDFYRGLDALLRKVQPDAAAPFEDEEGGDRKCEKADQAEAHCGERRHGAGLCV